MLVLAILLQAAASCIPVEADDPTSLRQHDAGVPYCQSKKSSTPDRPITPAEQAKIKAAFDVVFKDGPSTRWRFQKVRSGATACGYYNTKNGFGGYSGWNPFIFDLKTGSASPIEDNKIWFFMLICEGVDVYARPQG